MFTYQKIIYIYIYIYIKDKRMTLSTSQLKNCESGSMFVKTLFLSLKKMIKLVYEFCWVIKLVNLSSVVRLVCHL
jgi:hypothetical protein